MKPRVYVILLLLIIPVQATLLDPLSIGGIRPDAGLAVLYCIGLMTGPAEAALAGIAMGLMQDIGSASVIGFSGLTRGMIGLLAGYLGQHLLEMTSPSNIVMIAAFALAEGLLIVLFLQIFNESAPFFSTLLTRVLPTGLSTGVLGYFLLRLLARKSVLSALRRRSLQKE